MSTNYYVITNECECCKRYDEQHIGKSSVGWEFTFRGYQGELTSWDQWKSYLIGKTIRDEYSESVSYQDFVDMVEGPKSPGFVNPTTGRKNLSHNDAGKNDKYPWFNPEYDWYDNLGYSFSEREFS